MVSQNHAPECGVIRHEMAARLQRIEAAFVDMPAKLQVIRAKYNTSADSLRLLKAMIAMLPEDNRARGSLIAAAEITLSNLYALADVLSTLVQLELAASDYRVLVGLLIDDLDEGESQTNVSVFNMPDEAKEQVA